MCVCVCVCVHALSRGCAHNTCTVKAYGKACTDRQNFHIDVQLTMSMMTANEAVQTVQCHVCLDVSL